MKKSIQPVVLVFLFLTVLLSGCAPAPTPTPIPSTFTPSPIPPTFTPEPTATAAMNLSPTPVPGGQNNSKNIPANMASELKDLGFDLNNGEIGWMQPKPLSLINNGPNSQWMADILAPDPVFQDYALGVDIDWGKYTDTDRGGCGIFLRITKDQADAVLFYTSLQPFFNSWDLEHWNPKGFVGSLLKDQGSPLQPGIYSDDIHEGINHYNLVVSGNKVLVYVNGNPIKRVGSNEVVGPELIPDKIKEGTLAFFSRRTQGSFTCTFSNGWVWRLKP